MRYASVTQVKILHNLNHKNVLKFYNWYETRNHLWIIFEYCAGGDLLEMIEQDKKVGTSLISATLQPARENHPLFWKRPRRRTLLPPCQRSHLR